jgi:hypothetical protein
MGRGLLAGAVQDPAAQLLLGQDHLAGGVFRFQTMLTPESVQRMQ